MERMDAFGSDPVMRKKMEQYASAVARLEEVIAMKDIPEDVKRDSIIQRFEFSFELAWKGKHRYNSDIDLAIQFNGEAGPGFFLELDDRAGLYSLDVVNLNEAVDPLLLQEIREHGKVLYEKPPSGEGPS